MQNVVMSQTIIMDISAVLWLENYLIFNMMK